jgi:protein O-mannosyl-transferase
MSSRPNTARRTTLVCLLLAAATCAVYAPVWHAEFTNYDDFTMVTDNPVVLAGLTWRGLRWALTTFHHEYWHPLTWLSHMLDCELFGLRASGHHLVSLAFHVANTLLLFGVLQRMTGAWKRSALVAALFALHPLHVESVAWIAERKDVLSGFFFMLTLWAYARYAECRRKNAECRVPAQPSAVPRPTRNTQHCVFFYCLCLAWFALGLMCKPMLMTVPCVLLLLDFWPLRRFELKLSGYRFTALPFRLLAEKLPFLALAGVSAGLTYAWARGSQNILSATQEPWALRLANVPVSYARYLRKMIWPTDLFLPYPMPNHWAWWQVAGTVLVLVVITLFAVRRMRTAPYLIVGWLIFLGVLAPTIRVMHGGFQSIADRYTYLPSIGIFIAVVWAVADWAAPRRQTGMLPNTLKVGRAVPCAPPVGCGAQGTARPTFKGLGQNARTAAATAVAALALLFFGYLTWGLAGIWRSSGTLWTHSLALCPTNEVAHFNLGSKLVPERRWDEAAQHFQEGIRLNPANALPYNSLGKVYALQDKLEEAMPLFRKAIALDPKMDEAHFNLGKAYALQGKLAEAVVELQATLHGKSSDLDAKARQADAVLEAEARLADALIKLGRAAEALPYCEAVLRARPQDAHAHYALGEACLAEKRPQQAVASFKEAIRLAPDVPECLNALAWVYATCPQAEVRNGAEAVRIAERACQLTKRQKTAPLDTLAAAYAEAGRFDEALKTSEETLALALASHDSTSAETARQRLELYRAGKPYRDE